MTEEQEIKMVDDAFQHLLECYRNSNHRKKEDIIIKAFNFARQAHKGVRRLSGEPYILHPIAVAQIACEEVGLGSTSIASALLHDVVEDTDYTIEDIENIFGKKIAQIVDGLTKISGGIFGERASAQAENFKKLLLTMSDDIRVILIKICDRLHNMRTLASQPANKQYKIAGETLYIYAPLANRLGLNKIKTELEDLSFRYDHPDEYNKIATKLQTTQQDRDRLFEDFTTPIRESLDALGLSYQLKARVKTPYSIWNKMQKKRVSFDEIYDILAVRIIFTPSSKEEEVNDCFRIYVALCKIYNSHPDRLRDWVSHPKPNGYQALQVTFMSKAGRWIEVQIRSERMDELAEQGFASHWKYKEGGQISEDDTEMNEWLRTIKEILDDPQPDAMDFLDAIKLNLYASEIFVFTPKGEIRTMPAGCTALDFAFTIHSFIGTHCIGAKVNHKLVPLSHKLQSGDQVEILTSKNQHVQPQWVDFVSSAKAKAKIQALLRKQDRELQKLGEQILAEFLKRHDMDITVMTLDKLNRYHQTADAGQLFLALGKKTILLGEKDIEVIQQADELTEKQKKTRWKRLKQMLTLNRKKENEGEIDLAADEKGLLVAANGFDKRRPCILRESNMRMYIFPSCCHPIPGDDIMGFIDDKQHVEIHKRSCHVAEKLKSTYGKRILDARWQMDRTMLFVATIRIRGIDRMGLLHDVLEVISHEKTIDIYTVNTTSESGLFDAKLQLRIHDRDEIADLMSALKAVDGVEEVTS